MFAFVLVIVSIVLFDHRGNGYLLPFSRPLCRRRSASPPTAPYCVQHGTAEHRPRFMRIAAVSELATSEVKPTPGNPIVREIDEVGHIATIAVSVPGSATQAAFDRTCVIFNEEVKHKNFKLPGFRPGAKLPAQLLFDLYGEKEVKDFCGTLLSEAILAECELTGLQLVGRGRILNFRAEDFTPGLPHAMDIECDLWPEITYGGAKGYKGLEVTVMKDPEDNKKIDQVKQSIRERYKVLSPTPVGYTAQLGDVLQINMRGYEREEGDATPSNRAGFNRAKPLPAIASGDQVELLLEPGRFMPGLVEAMVGCSKGDTRTVDLTFPTRTTGPGASLSGKNATFEIQVLDVKTRTLPAWGEELAGMVREGMTLAALEAEVRAAIEGDASSNTENARNEALATALLNITTVSKLPESLVEEQTKSKYEAMLGDFKEQGASTEQLEAMLTPEKYARYKELSRPSSEKVVKLGLLFRDIIEKELAEWQAAVEKAGPAAAHDRDGDVAVVPTKPDLVVSPAEINEQWEMLVAQAKQKKEALPDKAAARDEIESVLLRKKVFNFLAQHATITYVEGPLAAQVSPPHAAS